MANYTEKEIAAFEAKDRLNSYMSALKAASTNNEGKGKTAAAILKEADTYYKQLLKAKEGGILVFIGDGKKGDGKKKETKSKKSDETLPVPTLQQKEILDAIVSQTGVDYDTICKEVLDWVEGKIGKRIYPGKKESIENFIKERKK